MGSSNDAIDIAAKQAQTMAAYGDFFLGLANHIVNVKQNRRNMQAIERQNALAAAESEKAYERSKPTTQVANMRQVGMSQAGAINALNGGGSYTPAPVAAGQEQMLDFSGMQNALANIAQHKQEEKLFRMNLAAQKEENAANRENAKEIAQIQAEASKYGADSSAGAAKYGADKTFEANVNRLEFDKSVHDYFKSDQRGEIRARIRNLESNTNLSNEQHRQLSSLYEITRESAVEAVNKVKEEIKQIKSSTDLAYKNYVLDKCRTIFESKLGEVNYLRNTIDFWRNPEQSSIIAKGVGWKTDYSKQLGSAEKDLEKYLDELETIIDLLK